MIVSNWRGTKYSSKAMRPHTCLWVHGGGGVTAMTSGKAESVWFWA